MKIKNLPALKLNNLSQEQYERALEEGRIKEDEMYFTPEEEITPEKIGAIPVSAFSYDEETHTLYINT